MIIKLLLFVVKAFFCLFLNKLFIMKKTIITLIVLITIFACKNQSAEKNVITMTYPETKTVDTVDTYLGVEVEDPFCLLEDGRSSET